MIIFDGKYSWSGKKNSEFHPISWWAGAYWLKIIDLSKNGDSVLMLKPIIVIVADTGEGASATNCASELVKSICRDFDLDIRKVLWVEYHPGPPDHMKIGKFTSMATLHEETLYTTAWRPIRRDELEMISPYSSRATKILENDS
jgi:hypothetical protein